MNDEFLYQARPKLRQEFADELYARLSGEKNTVTRFWRSVSLNPNRALRLGSAIVIGLVIIVACARQLLEPRNIQVGTIWVQEGDDTIPIPKGWGVDISPEEPVLLSPPDTIPIDQAIGMLPYELKVPVWTPEGYLLAQNNVLPPLSPSWMMTLSWANTNNQNEQILLFVRYGLAGEIRVPKGMWKEVSLDGLPAVLIRGGFPYSKLPPPNSLDWETGVELTWDKNTGLRLEWDQDGARFSLQTSGDYLDEDDLIRMAESMRTW